MFKFQQSFDGESWETVDDYEAETLEEANEVLNDFRAYDEAVGLADCGVQYRAIRI